MDTRQKSALCAVLEAELALLCGVSALQERAKEAVRKREWAEFELFSCQVSNAYMEFEALEQKRLETPDTKEPEAAALKRALKSELDKITWTGRTLTRYIEEQRALTCAFIEAVYPEKRSSVYSREGKRAGADMRSLVVDYSF